MMSYYNNLLGYLLSTCMHRVGHDYFERKFAKNVYFRLPFKIFFILFDMLNNVNNFLNSKVGKH